MENERIISAINFNETKESNVTKQKRYKPKLVRETARGKIERNDIQPNKELVEN